MSRKKVVVTGLGGLCGLGGNAADIWGAMRAGQCAIGPITLPDLGDLKCRIGAQIQTIPDIGLVHRQKVSMDRFSLLAVTAAHEALLHSGVTVDDGNALRIGTTMGVGICGAVSIEEGYHQLYVEGKNRVNVFTVPRIMPGAASGQVSMTLGLKGPVFGVTSACSSSNQAISAAADQIRLGRADVMIAGGAEAPFSFGGLKAWEALRVLAQNACRPFSADREGLVIGEGAGALVLESLEHAQARGATILAELAGSGVTADAADIVAPSVEGPRAAILACLADAGASPDDVDYINAHGTATLANDKVETAAIHGAFGERSRSIPVSSTKSMHAHCLGAAGALEAIACIMAIRDNVVPPTIGYNEPDPECDLDVTPNEAREHEVNLALSNSFAFGGTNAVLAFRAFA